MHRLTHSVQAECQSVILAGVFLAHRVVLLLMFQYSVGIEHWQQSNVNVIVRVVLLRGFLTF